MSTYNLNTMLVSVGDEHEKGRDNNSNQWSNCRYPKPFSVLLSLLQLSKEIRQKPTYHSKTLGELRIIVGPQTN